MTAQVVLTELVHGHSLKNATDTNTVFGVTGDRGTVVLGDLELDTDLEVQYGGTGVAHLHQRYRLW